MPRTQVFAFDIHDKVLLTEINRPGVVVGLSVNESAVEYRVVFWNDCQRRSEWVYEHEIKSIEQPI